MEVSIGVITYNEGKNIGKLLRALVQQKTSYIQIKEIIVVSSGSTDKTEEIVMQFSEKYENIGLVSEEKRNGKALAINKFIANASTNNLVLMSGDILPESDFVEKISSPLKNKNTGVVACRPIPLMSNGFLGFVTNLQWKLNHKISLKSPKFGEAIAFKKIFQKLPSTAVDEEYIAMMAKKYGLRGVYQKNAIVYNKGPQTLKDYLIQRRRIYCGHKYLLREGYIVSSLNYSLIFKSVLEMLKVGNMNYIIMAFIMEGVGRFLGWFDYMKRKEHTIWTMAESTKELRMGSKY